jgi:hypothetical protein
VNAPYYKTSAGWRLPFNGYVHCVPVILILTACAGFTCTNFTCTIWITTAFTVFTLAS